MFTLAMAPEGCQQEVKCSRISGTAALRAFARAVWARVGGAGAIAVGVVLVAPRGGRMA